MHDKDIRRALRGSFLHRYESDGESVIVDELGVCNGAARVDVAVVNGELLGYELKSPSDSLVRLRSQVESYSKVFDRMTLVVSSRHFDQARLLVPQWWGLITVCEKPMGSPDLRQIRKGARNRQVSALAVAQLLWREEALTLLSEFGLSKGLISKPKQVLWQKLASDLKLDELSQRVRGILKSRTGWRN